MATTYEIFEKAERIERIAAAVYGALAERFASDREARSLFARLEAEELQHASRVRLLAARYRHDPKLVERAPVEAPELERLIAEIEAVAAAVRDGTWGTDLGEVKRNLSALEVRFARAHAELIARDARPELRDFFAQLARQDEEHARLLAG